MKTKITLIVILMSITTIIFAQQSSKESNPNWRRSQNFFELLSRVNKANHQAKTRATDERMIAEVYEETVIEDSLVYSYSAGRGSIEDDQFGLFFDDHNYDQRVDYDLPSNPSLWYKSNRTYNGNNLVLNESDSSYNGTGWDPSTLRMNTYNTSNQLTSTVYQSWNGTAMQNSYKTDYTYVGNNLQSEINMSWNGTAWENASKTEKVWTSNNLTEETTSSWLGTNWKANLKYINTYNANNDLSTETIQIIPGLGTVWENSYRTSFSYNMANQVTEVLSESWDGMVWENSDKVAVVWNGSIPSEFTFEDWSGTAWEKDSRNTLTHNANDNVTRELYESWNGTTYVYDPANFDTYKYRYYYETYNNNVRTKDVANVFGAIKIYPNPANQVLHINVEKNNTASKEISIIDLKGMIVLKTTLEKNINESQLSLKNIAAGTYLINIKNVDGTSYTTKFTKQ